MFHAKGCSPYHIVNMRILIALGSLKSNLLELKKGSEGEAKAAMGLRWCHVVHSRSNLIKQQLDVTRGKSQVLMVGRLCLEFTRKLMKDQAPVIFLFGTLTSSNKGCWS